ncbi:hypothetical protein C8R44DRAFT_888794 [Mycena epipterygia]|nr:hypothetical protein C8R44DRAFT_888794 [Mycena epipterygia]
MDKRSSQPSHFLLVHDPSMPFVLNGTHIEGGTFNNVAGNMTQVFNSHVSHVGISEGRSGEGTHALLHSTPSSIGAIRTDRVSRQRSDRPYDVTDRRRRDDHQESDPPPMNGGRDSPSRDMHTGQATRASPPAQQDIIPHQSPPGSFEPISNHIYNSIGGDLNVTSYGESGIDILYRYVVMEALHDSGERFPEPACHPGTRTEIIDQLRSWSVDMNPTNPILWLHGSAGLGKSAIAQMFAGECQKERRLGASFFFKRGHPKRGTWHGLITTVAYQIAKSVPGFMSPVQQAVHRDKLVVGCAITVQFQRLIAEPFSDTPNPEIIPVIILDGLDECEDPKVQQQILRLFIGAIRGPQPPIRLIIVSRPEPHLREILGATEICRPLLLSADQTAYDNIRKYLWDEFSRIHSECMARGVDLGANWPTEGTLNHLVQKSSGIFIYATTVIRFVGDGYCHPADRLASVLSRDPLSTAPLDDLYTEILSVLSQEQNHLRILHAIWCSTLPRGFEIGPEEIDMLLQLRPGTCRLLLHGLHSVFNVPPMRTRLSLRNVISALHASLLDYLGDARRSGGWCVSKEWLATDYLHSMIRLLSVPPLTDCEKEFHCRVVNVLPIILEDATHSDDLVVLLRNTNFQDSLLMPGHQISWSVTTWPQRDSPYPLDLTQLWEDHRYIFTLISQLGLPGSGNRRPPTCRFDAIYTEIFSNHQDLMLVLQALIIQSHNHLPQILRYFGPTWNYRVFQPFLGFREVLELPIPEGDSPLDFLNDPRRAGNMYADPRNIAGSFGFVVPGNF